MPATVNPNPKLFERLVEAAPDAIVVVGRDGNIVLANAQTERIFGYARVELIGHPVEILTPLRFREVHIRRRTGYFAAPGVRPMGGGTVLYGRRKDGAEFPIEISLSPIETEEGPFAMAAIRDVTERERARAQLTRLLEDQSARKQLEAANRMKDEFLVTLSHELRTPLNAILGWSQLLRRGHLTEPQVERALEIVERNARSQLRLIEDLLDVSRIVSGKIQVQCRPTDLREVIRHAMEVISPAADAKGLKLSLSHVRSIDCIVNGDPDRLQQVIWNLLSNAVKFTPSGGHVQVSMEQMDHRICIAVEDSGEGIAPEFLPDIFDRFSQADSSTTRTHGGLGLGLAIVRHLVEAHGGSVDATSDGKGKGAKFTVHLPAHDQAVVDPTSDSSSLQSSLRGVRLLVVDDRPDELTLFTEIFERAGADVTTASNAETALELLRQSRPDVLVTDLAMPQQDGYELIRKVRELFNDAHQALPAVAVTAHAAFENRERALAAGFQAFVSKPVDSASLVETVAGVLR